MQPHNFFSTDATPAPQLAATPWGAPHPAPSARKSATRTAQKTALCAPASTQEDPNPKIGQQLGAQPTPRIRGMGEARLDALLATLLEGLPTFTFQCPRA